MTTSSLPMGLIINSLVMLPMWLESGSPTPCKLASLHNINLTKTLTTSFCAVWQMIAGPIHHYLDNPLLVYWIPKSDDFYTKASNFLRNN
jgi:hypothetical protein